MKILKEYYLILKKKAVTLLILALLLVGYLLFFHFVLPDTPSCFYKQVFGIPCPGCGITRSFVSLIQFDIKNAFHYNYLFWIYPIIGFVIIFRERPRVEKVFHSKIFWILCTTLVIGVYIYRLVNLFPNPPMEYYPLNLIERIKRWFR